LESSQIVGWEGGAQLWRNGLRYGLARRRVESDDPDSAESDRAVVAPTTVDELVNYALELETVLKDGIVPSSLSDSTVTSDLAHALREAIAAQLQDEP